MEEKEEARDISERKSEIEREEEEWRSQEGEEVREESKRRMEIAGAQSKKW